MNRYLALGGVLPLLLGPALAQSEPAAFDEVDYDLPSDPTAYPLVPPIHLPNGAVIEGPITLEALGVSVYHAWWHAENGEANKIYFLPDGTLVDMTWLRTLNREVHQAVHGKFSPTLSGILQNAKADEEILAVVWLHAPSTEDARIEMALATETLDDLGQFTHDDRARFRAALNASIQTRIRPVTSAAAERYREAGIEVVSFDDLVPIVFVRATARQLSAIATDAEVESVDWAGQVYVERLNVAVQTVMKNYLVHTIAGGNTGAGARVSVVEGGRVCETNPCMTVTMNNGSGSVATHTTGVGSCIKSSDPTYKGVAPGCSLYSAGGADFTANSTNVTTQMPGSVSAVNWSNSTALADIMNLSYGAGAPGSTVSSFDRFLDWVVRNNAVSIAIACGNSGAFAGDPGAGFNQLAVGNFSDNATTGWGDDFMAGTSSWQNPSTGVETPQLAAPGTSIRMLSCATGTPCATAYTSSGTSFSSPITAGTAALLVSDQSALGSWPEPVRAILMATAWHNIEGSATLSSMDGAGGVNARAAWRVADRGKAPTGNGFNYGTLIPSSFNASGNFDAMTNAPAVAGQKVRAVLSWDSNPSGGPTYSSNPLQADLDLRVIRNDTGTTVASSSSGIQPFEVVQFTAPVTGNYTVRIFNFSFTGTSEFYGVAFSTSGDN